MNDSGLDIALTHTHTHTHDERGHQIWLQTESQSHTHAQTTTAKRRPTHRPTGTESIHTARSTNTSIVSNRSGNSIATLARLHACESANGETETIASVSFASSIVYCKLFRDVGDARRWDSNRRRRYSMDKTNTRTHKADAQMDTIHNLPNPLFAKLRSKTNGQSRTPRI